MIGDFDINALLAAIDPAGLPYEEWLQVGQALHHEGLSVALWDAWSARDGARYKFGDCAKRWAGFGRSSGTPVTMGTIVKMAQDHGWHGGGRALDWDDMISDKDDHVVVKQGWVEDIDLQEPERWDPAEQLIDYLETLFEAGENVGYVTESWYDEEKQKHFPKAGSFSRTAGQLIEEIRRYKGDLGAALGDYAPEVGAWIRFNPFDGQGIKNENVTTYRYALVESDSMPIGQQNAILRELELPIACLVHSGGKSLHAIVRIDAVDYREYQKRVDYLYDVCRKNGFEIDKANKNPSRLSRMPGVLRNGHKQWLVDKNIGKDGWKEWEEWVESVNDDLPEPVSMAEVWDNMPPLSPSLIDGVLRRGHKMLLAGPSKAGKSYLLIGLACAMAEGKTWLGWPVAQTRVMYVNLEVDTASALNRFKEVYKALGWAPENIQNIEVWNLRGKAAPMDKLAPKLIRRAMKREYGAIIIDPIYKVITGDENSADQMAKFCNQFDLIACQLGAAVIYCHHHSKGYQGQKKSMDRSSGSGVFARDPDAYLDMTELEKTKALIKVLKDKACCKLCEAEIRRLEPLYFEDHVGPDDLMSATQMMMHAKKALTSLQYEDLVPRVRMAEEKAEKRTAWRIEGTLREYETFPPVNIWFDYPVHREDDTGSLRDLMPEVEKPSWQRAMERRKEPEVKKEERINALEIAFAALEEDGEVTTDDLADHLGVSRKTIYRRVKESGSFEIVKKENPADPAEVRRKA